MDNHRTTPMRQFTDSVDGVPATSAENPLVQALITTASTGAAVHAALVIHRNYRTSDASVEPRASDAGPERDGQLSAIFGQTTAGIAQTDLSGRFVFVNPRYCEIVGRSAEELYGLRMQDISHADDRPGNNRQFQRLIAEGREFTVEKRYVRPDGTAVWVHNCVSLLRDHEGQASYAVAFTLDITARKRTERAQERLVDQERVTHDELTEVDRRKDEFLAMLGHELRNPLSDIVSAAQILEQLSCHDPAAREMHGIIKRQSVQMTRLIDDLLDISRIACGKILLNMVRLDFVALTRNAVADHQHQMDTNQLTLDLDLPDAPLWVIGDPTRLSQVVANLLHNASKFTDAGGTICVLLDRQGEFASLGVKDTGIGMEPTEVAAMFEPFRQAESNRVRSQGGLGLGLALSKQLIEKHGGSITAASDGLGHGSVFSIRLPLDRAIVPELLQPAIPASDVLPSHRVLIVDDRRDARLTLTMLLERLGQEVAQAQTGAAALEAAREFVPEIIICDIGLPDMDGYDVARAMRAEPALNGARLVALTGYGQAEDRDRALQAGFDEHLTKPVSHTQLQELLQQIRSPRSAGH